jgi:vanadium chloroperoxidase
MLTLPAVDDPDGLNDFPVLYWNHVGLQMNRITHSLGGPQGGPTMSSRALGLLHLAMHDAYFAVLGMDEKSDPPTYLPDVVRPKLPAGLPSTLDSANKALCGAAVTVLDLLYDRPVSAISIVARETLSSALSSMVADYQPGIAMLSPEHHFGKRVAEKICDLLAVKPGEIGADQGRYQPMRGRYKFRDEPVVPLRRVPIDPNEPSRGKRTQRTYHGPFYGKTVPAFAVTDLTRHELAPWPEDDYKAALKEVVRLGGAPGLPGTSRTPDETVAGYFWAYDGVNLIGTPPRLYNQILRVVASKMAKKDKADPEQHSEFVRLFALCNTAMADAGKLAWLEKYKYELWRPLSGVREHDTGDNEKLDECADPFWQALGAPETNSHQVAFKPPFPAYPSGHATFGAACFQMARLFYKKRDGLMFDDNGADEIGFSFVSEELDGISRDLDQPFDPSLPIEDQPGVIRTRVKRHFRSLWHAIFENAFSRIYLGVHWRFDAADAEDIQYTTGKNTGKNKDPKDITYSNVWTPEREPDDRPIGGVPLGLGIANDIFINQMKAPMTIPDEGTPQSVKISNTTRVGED